MDSRHLRTVSSAVLCSASSSGVGSLLQNSSATWRRALSRSSSSLMMERYSAAEPRVSLRAMARSFTRVLMARTSPTERADMVGLSWTGGVVILTPGGYLRYLVDELVVSKSAHL